MKLRRTAAIYAIVVGFTMIGMWIMLLATGQVPELSTTPIEITFLLVVEFLTAIMLLIGGFGLITNRNWGFKAYLLSMGLLIYAVVNAAGHSGQQGDLAMIVVFGVVFVLAVIFIVSSFYEKGETSQ